MYIVFCLGYSVYGKFFSPKLKKGKMNKIALTEITKFEDREIEIDMDSNLFNMWEDPKTHATTFEYGSKTIHVRESVSVIFELKEANLNKKS